MQSASDASVVLTLLCAVIGGVSVAFAPSSRIASRLALTVAAVLLVADSASVVLPVSLHRLFAMSCTLICARNASVIPAQTVV
jgi:hypothetical protein